MRACKCLKKESGDDLLKKIYKTNFLKDWYDGHTINANSIVEYLALPHSKRHFFGWIYRPFNIRRDVSVYDNWFTVFDLDNKTRQLFIRNNYPIQYFFREICFSKFINFKYELEIFYEKVKNSLFPNQKWLYKKLPKQWVESDVLIEIVLFEIVIHYIEQQKALEIVHFGNEQEEKELLECYNFITKEKKKLEKECQEEMKRLSMRSNITTPNSSEDYDNLTKIETEISEKTEYYLQWILKHRELFWV